MPAIQPSGHAQPSTRPFVAVIPRDDPHLVLCAARSGALGIVLSNSPEAIRVQIVRLVAAGQAALDPALHTAALGIMGTQPTLDVNGSRFGLTGREQDVMSRIACGDCNRKIAATLYISVKTVKNHVNRIYAKLSVTNRGAAIARWLGTDAEVDNFGQASSRTCDTLAVSLTDIC